MLDAAGALVLARAGLLSPVRPLLSPVRPDRLAGAALAAVRYGVSPATGYAAGAARHPRRPALVDDVGVLTYRDVDRRSDRIAGELAARGVRPGHAVGLLARNGRGFVETATALAKCGADVLYLGTGTPAAQLAQVLDREGARLCVTDSALASPLLPGPTTEELGVAAALPGPRAPAHRRRSPRQVLLTSGTTGVPRGAARSGGRVGDAVAALSRVPLRTGGTTVLAAPLFHAWGLGQLALAVLLGSTVVLRRTFDPAQVLADVAAHRADALVVVPVLLDQLLAADPSRHDLSSLRVVASSGSALPGDLAARTAAALGPVLHNVYGSTEVAYAAVASPRDLAEDPRTAGRPPHGVRLRVVDDAGRDAPPGVPGRVFVGSGLVFDGYTDGGDRPRLSGLVATGDRGLLDRSGRLTVLGRDDDMVVVGGENVFPGAVEDVLLQCDAVREAAVVGEPDPSYGVRLVAHVVLARDVPGRELQDLVRDRLARAAVPREVRVHDALPRGATGKVLTRELRT